MHSGPLYISEISPPSLRGRLVSSKEALIVTGLLFSYLLGYVRFDAIVVISVEG